MGVCKLPDKAGEEPHIYRRIDIKTYPRAQFGFALLYFTGSCNFNKKMRSHALQKGFSLSDSGLVPTKYASKDLIAHFEGLECPTEQDVF